MVDAYLFDLEHIDMILDMSSLVSLVEMVVDQRKKKS